MTKMERVSKLSLASNEDFGTFGWSFQNKERAEIFFNSLVEQQK